MESAAPRSAIVQAASRNKNLIGHSGKNCFPECQGVIVFKASMSRIYGPRKSVSKIIRIQPRIILDPPIFSGPFLLDMPGSVQSKFSVDGECLFREWHTHLRMDALKKLKRNIFSCVKIKPHG